MNEKIYKAARTLIEICGNCKKEERILFVTDDTSKEIAEFMWEASCDYPNRTMIRMEDRTMHGEEPPATVAAAMLSSDVIYGTTRFSLFHTDARRNAVAAGSRFVNMADYNLEMMENGGLHEDFLERGGHLERISSRIEGDLIRIETPAGTCLECAVTGKKSVPQYGRSAVAGVTSSPPDIEWAIGPLEGRSNGTIVVDGSIPHPLLGLIADPITLRVKDGYIVEITGGRQADILRKVFEDVHDRNALHVAEVGIGMNRKARLSGSMLEDEGCDGTMHFGIGSNISFGGNMNCASHIDLICKKPTISVDGRVIVDNGTVLVD